MTFFADTGFLISLYLNETTSPLASAVMANVDEPVPVTPLTDLEFRTALQLNLFRGEITETERAAAWQSYQEDFTRGIVQRVDFDAPAAFAEAASLSDRFVAAHGARTLDLLQVASALVLRCSTLLSFDRRQRAIAIAVGLKLLPENV
jgi:predicted nucleic acid-binding protein